MYAQFFGLSHEPFSIAPDPRYLFMSERHREALAHLLYGVSGGGGFVLLSGEIGTGKTTVCRCFLEQIPPNCDVAYIFNPKLSAQELLRSVCDEFHVPYRAADPAASPTAKDYVDALNAFLLAQHAAGKNSVLVIDEAQNLSADVLEQLRLLTNLETNERKLLQIMLIGQPELRAMLARPELEQLSQRVLARFHLDALSEAETMQYIQHRLSVAGLTGPVPFDRQAFKRIQQLSGGVPRRINLLCDRALLGAYATGRGMVDKAIVNKAAGEVFEDPEFLKDTRTQSPRWVPMGAGLVAGLVLAGGAAMVLAPLLADRMYDRKNVAKAGAPIAASQPAASAALPVASGGSTHAQTDAAMVASMPAAAASVRAAPASAVSLVSTGTAALTVTATNAAELQNGFKRLLLSQSQGVRELGKLWHIDLAGDDPCTAAAAQQVQCHRDDDTLDTLRRLGRPAVLSLRDASGHQAWALLAALNDRTATLRAGADSNAATMTVPVAVLESVWQGGWMTLWRTPPGFQDRLGDKGPAVDWVAAHLAMADHAPAPRGGQAMDKKLLTRLKAFQKENGLSPDGRAGPKTLMVLNQATGVDEPRLGGGR